MYDPFRLQFLTVSLDSEVVLALVGLCTAWLAVRAAAHGQGRSPAGLHDLALDVGWWALVGARLGWVVTHADYYVRAPVQVAAVGDGGFLFGTGILGSALLLWRRRTRSGLTWAELAAIAAPAIVVALLLDRAGCALTACGAGQPTDAPWALVRSGASLHPVGIYGIAVWLATLGLLCRGSNMRLRRQAWVVLLGGLVLERSMAWRFGHEGWDGLAVSGALLLAVAAFGWRRRLGWLAKRAGQVPS